MDPSPALATQGRLHLSLTGFILAQIESKAVERAAESPMAGRAHGSPVRCTSGHGWIVVGPKEGAINRERCWRNRHCPEQP